MELNVLGRPFVDQFAHALGVLDWLADQKQDSLRSTFDAIEYVRELVEREANQ